MIIRHICFGVKTVVKTFAKGIPLLRETGIYMRNDLQFDVLLFSDYLFQNYYVDSCKLLLYCLLQARDVFQMGT